MASLFSFKHSCTMRRQDVSLLFWECFHCRQQWRHAAHTAFKGWTHGKRHFYPSTESWHFLSLSWHLKNDWTMSSWPISFVLLPGNSGQFLQWTVPKSLCGGMSSMESWISKSLTRTLIIFDWHSPSCQMKTRLNVLVEMSATTKSSVLCH